MNEQTQEKTTAGNRYVAEYLTQTETVACSDLTWIAESIDDGSLHVCPRCHFLSLPVRPFPLCVVAIGRLEDGTDPPLVDNCDVCAHLSEACQIHYPTECLSHTLDEAPAQLQAERNQRAETLFRLWMGASTGADALLMAKMTEARNGLRVGALAAD